MGRGLFTLHFLLHSDPAFPTSPTVPDLSITSNPALTSSYSTVNSEAIFMFFNVTFANYLEITLKMMLIKCASPCLRSNSSATCDHLPTEWKHFWNCARWVIHHIHAYMHNIFRYNNGAMPVIQSLVLGSGLEIFCRVLTECQMADSTDVAWLVNGQSVGSSYMDGRALQGGRR